MEQQGHCSQVDILGNASTGSTMVAFDNIVSLGLLSRRLWSVHLPKKNFLQVQGGGNICGGFPINAWQADGTVSVGECLLLLSGVSMGSRAFSEL